MPTPLMLECLDTLLPVITSQINLSLEYGVFPDMWKEAIGYPLLKKVDLGSSFPNLRLISNLSYISKLTEKAVFQQLNNHLLINKLYPKLQSAYRKYHSTETALLKITNDILLNMSNQQVSLLVLLDLSAAFDTIDHSVLLNRLKQNFGINGTALSWFKSYVTNRKLRIHVDGSISKEFALNHGVPQGSCLGPLLFIIYASDMFSVIDNPSQGAHGYADDTQLYRTLNPNCAGKRELEVEEMENCISNLREWMAGSKLKMNDDKTDCMLIGTRQQISKVDLNCISVGEKSITPSSNLSNLGILMDTNLTFHEQINKLCKTSFYFLHNIRKIRKYLTTDATATLVHALVISRLDYCNSLMYGLPAYQIAKLQRVQNSAARLVYMVPKFVHISPFLKELHWLPVKYRIEFKILILTFQAIHGLAPEYLCDLIQIRELPNYNLRRSNEIFLTVPSHESPNSIGDRAFKFAAPKLWNRLPKEIRHLDSLDNFKKQLKTYLFRLAYDITI